MIYNFEYELKLMLNEEEFKELNKTDGERGFLQINHYFDTPAYSMWDSKVVIRVREIKNSYELTIKKKSGDRDADGVISMDEYNQDICPEVALGLIEGRLDVKEFLPEDAVYNDIQLRNIGSVATFRRKIRINGELPMAELDKSVYDDRVDFELEWEISDKDYKNAVDSLEKLGISIRDRETGRSKYGRLVDSKRKGN